MNKQLLLNKLAVLITAFLLLSSSLDAQKRKAERDTKSWRYEIEAVATGTQGHYLIKVWSYSRNPQVAMEQAKKNAVHGIVFKGFQGKQGVPGQKALCSNPNIENERSDYFDNFFADGGNYMRFINLSGDGSIRAEDRIKVGKEYKIGVIVSVNVAGLRKELEDAGIIKGLGSGF